MDKASRKSIKNVKPWHDVEHIRDSFRFKTVLKDIEDLPKIAEDLKETGFEVIKADTDKVLEPGPWGWRIAAFDLKMPNGQLVEYYLPVQELEQAKKNGNHKLFEKWRNADMDKLSAKEQLEYLNDLDDSNDRYEQAWSDYCNRTKQKPDRVRALNSPLLYKDPMGLKCPKGEQVPPPPPNQEWHPPMPLPPVPPPNNNPNVPPPPPPIAPPSPLQFFPYSPPGIVPSPPTPIPGGLPPGMA